MPDFAQELAAWQLFFTTLAVVCATLAGLLFVSLSLHAAALRDDRSINLRRLAQQTFGDFVQVLFISLFFLVPKVSPEFFGISVLLTLIIGFRPLVALFIITFRDRAHAQHRDYFFTRLGMSLLGRAMVAAGGVGFILWHDSHPDVWEDFMFVFAGGVVLLMAAMRNAWFLLMHELTT